MKIKDKLSVRGKVYRFAFSTERLKTLGIQTEEDWKTKIAPRWREFARKREKWYNRAGIKLFGLRYLKIAFPGLRSVLNAVTDIGITSNLVVDAGKNEVAQWFLGASFVSGWQYCVPANTLILGDNKPIQVLGEGDKCIGITGHQEIDERIEREYQGDILEVKAVGSPPFMITPEHPLLTIRGKWGNEGRKFGNALWTIAKDLKGGGREKDYLIIPRLEGTFSEIEVPLTSYIKPWTYRKVHTSFPVTEESAWLLGLYVADGSTGAGNIQISLNRAEPSLITKTKSVLEYLGYKSRNSSIGNEINVVTGARILARALSEWCGKGAPNKRIPEFILFHKNPKVLSAFLEGYLQGDGCNCPSKIVGLRHFGSYQTSCTVSPILAYQLQLLAARLGIFAAVQIDKRAGTSQIQGRTVTLKDRYIVSYWHKTRKAKVYDKCILVPLVYIKRRIYNGKVYNLRTKDNTYLVNNLVVHNCGIDSSTQAPAVTDTGEITALGARKQFTDRFLGASNNIVIQSFFFASQDNNGTWNNSVLAENLTGVPIFARNTFTGAPISKTSAITMTVDWQETVS